MSNDEDLEYVSWGGLYKRAWISSTLARGASKGKRDEIDHLVAESIEHAALIGGVSVLAEKSGRLLIYTEAEWRDLERQGGRFAEMLARDTVWIVTPQPRRPRGRWSKRDLRRRD